MRTFAPAAASRVATALPIPVPPPVITATFPVRASAMRASSVLARTIRNHCASWTKRCANSHSSSGPHDGPPASFRGKFLDEDVLVLQQARWTCPLAIALAAVVLQGEAAAGRQIGDLGARDDDLAVQDGPDRIAADGDLEPVPLADGVVGLHPGRHGRAELGRGAGIGADAIHLARADGPAPDVDLVGAGTPQIDSRIRVGQGQLEFHAMNVPGVGAVGQDVGNIRVCVRRFLDPPVHMQLEVAEFAFQPEALVSPGLALGIVVDRAIHDLPVPAIPLRHLPAGEVPPVKECGETRWRLVVGRPGRGGEAQNEQYSSRVATERSYPDLDRASERRGIIHRDTSLVLSAGSYGLQSHRSARRGAEQGSAWVVLPWAPSAPVLIK